MTYPKTQEELKNFAGQRVRGVKLELKNIPDNVTVIVGREDKIGISFTCINCLQVTYLVPKDREIVKTGAVPLCSKCYFEALVKE